ncbi:MULTISPECIES: hypothetical protein [Rossellomorea]|uniref:Uncharacterized protein n=2 Tax=Rossellomorea marisflavi TaxID=189381 RepID=A0A5D4RYR0_9BACI|nr:hypothetical protein [Rossellomorea marisflavi]MBV6682326.1 hypothetical protein [Bacillus sp. JRC01]KMK92419.1 hypothetical protein VL03_17355 [Rossellomorea marisflavi]KML08267.1 hypothetical protein VL06_02055 [Rossellomorea marisflavi]MCM2603207.1 hypothetical protein [Rossellomorea marisflavi]MDW4525265.1 hypothetical protein [Rossellomorea marisflavi]
MIVFLYIGMYLTPILSIIFCLNLVTIMKKIKRDEKTAINTFWLTLSFTLIAWTLVMITFLGLE